MAIRQYVISWEGSSKVIKMKLSPSIYSEYQPEMVCRRDGKTLDKWYKNNKDSYLTVVELLVEDALRLLIKGKSPVSIEDVVKGDAFLQRYCGGLEFTEKLELSKVEEEQALLGFNILCKMPIEGCPTVLEELLRLDVGGDRIVVVDKDACLSTSPSESPFTFVRRKFGVETRVMDTTNKVSPELLFARKRVLSDYEFGLKLLAGLV